MSLKKFSTYMIGIKEYCNITRLLCICLCIFFSPEYTSHAFSQSRNINKISHGRTIFSDALQCHANEVTRVGAIVPQLYIADIVDATQDYFDPYGNGQFILHKILEYALNIGGVKPITQTPIVNSYALQAQAQFAISLTLKHFERHYPAKHNVDGKQQENFSVKMHIKLVDIQTGTVIVDHNYATILQAYLHTHTSMQIHDMTQNASSVLARPYNVKLVETILQRLLFEVLTQLHGFDIHLCGQNYNTVTDPFYALTLEHYNSYRNNQAIIGSQSALNNHQSENPSRLHESRHKYLPRQIPFLPLHTNDTNLTTSSVNRQEGVGYQPYIHQQNMNNLPSIPQDYRYYNNNPNFYYPYRYYQQNSLQKFVPYTHHYSFYQAYPNVLPLRHRFTR